jgi:protein involved in polysaccharide export with SLBB domain
MFRVLSKTLTVRAIVLSLIAIGAPAPAAAQSPDDATEVPVLQAGDVVRITVWRKPELSGEFQVLPSGAIGDPFFMSVQVAGVPLPSATARIRAQVEQIETNPSVLVEPLYRVIVGGEVRQPNLYLLAPPMTVMQAIVQAGGQTERARRDRIRVVRNGTAAEWPASRAFAEQLRSGDQIFVDRQQSVMREYVLPAIGVAGSLASILRWLR